MLALMMAVVAPALKIFFGDLDARDEAKADSFEDLVNRLAHDEKVTIDNWESLGKTREELAEAVARRKKRFEFRSDHDAGPAARADKEQLESAIAKLDAEFAELKEAYEHDRAEKTKALEQLLPAVRAAEKAVSKLLLSADPEKRAAYEAAVSARSQAPGQIRDLREKVAGYTRDLAELKADANAKHHRDRIQSLEFRLRTRNAQLAEIEASLPDLERAVAEAKAACLEV